MPSSKIVVSTDAPCHEIDHQSNRIPIVLFAVGVLSGLFQLVFSTVNFGSGFEMIAIARNVAEHGTFGNPFWAMNTGPTAANPPMYPLYLAALMKVFRTPFQLALAAAASNIAANAFAASWLPKVSKLFFGSVRPGIVSAILWLACVQLMPSWDTSFTVAELLIFCTYSASALRKPKGLISASFAGGIAAVLFLLNPSSLLIFLPWVGYLLVRRWITLRKAATLLATLALIVSVWVMRNYVQLGSFVVRTNLGMTLYASNNDCAGSSLIADESNNCYQTHHPNQSMDEARLLHSLGEVAYDRRRTADAKAWIASHPSQFRTLIVERFREFWLPPANGHPFKSYVIWTVTALSIPGLVLLILQREPVTLFVLTVLILYPLMYYIVVSDVRYVYPVLWLTLLLSGYFIWRCFKRVIS